MGDLTVFSTRIDRENLNVTRVERENQYEFANWSLKSSVGGATLSNRLATQVGLLERVPRVTEMLSICLKLCVILFRSLK